MQSKIIRKKFLEFFQSFQHKIVPSAPIVVKGDPTLMFTNAGMNPFKDYFLGTKVAADTRLANTQKCLRVSGKHNDLEEVGSDGYHHTMFEMLGNWSFGDYFKAEAIEMAWKLLTEVYRLDKNRLYITVFEGDAADGLEADSEAFELWKKWVPKSQILFFSKKDNFWEMGDTGPCGPCSEIHIDLRPDEARRLRPGHTLVNAGTPEVIEIWNLVFIQYNRKADGSLEELSAKHVDTGMGLERMAMVLQGKTASYDTDLFQPLIQFIADYCGIAYTGSYAPEAKSDMAMRVIADHIRAVTFAITDGAVPSNTGPGYVIRRILRRAVRYYFTFLGIKEPFLYKLVPIVEDLMAESFPELIGQSEFSKRIIREEEISFLRTLAEGLRRLDQLQVTDNLLPGKIAFELYDTYGFPFDLTCLIARENNWSVDAEGYYKAMEDQKNRSRADARKMYGDWHVLIEGQGQFIGYDVLSCDSARIVRWRQAEIRGQNLIQLVLDTTPFYAEGGGQIGDTGILISQGEVIQVLDTIREFDLIIHIADRLPSDPYAPLSAKVDVFRRHSIQSNHSATHLLHAALRKLLGTHVQQKGSLVHDRYLRFDFSHFKKVEMEELESIEKLVNEKIRENIKREEVRHLSLEEARDMGAMMLFGEKYGEKVRMITFDAEFSRELCGGCHVESTGQIGFFKIVAESAVAAGIRRIEAVTSAEAEEFIRSQLKSLEEIRHVLKNSKDPVVAIRQLQQENKQLLRQLDDLRQAQAMQAKSQIIEKAQAINGINVLVEIFPSVDVRIAKNLLFQIGKELSPSIILTGFEDRGRPQLMCYISEEIAGHNAYDAARWIKQISPLIDGGGGGQSFFASAGGENRAGLEQALEQGKKIIVEALQMQVG